MKRILIVAALPGELKILKKSYNLYKNPHMTCDFLCSWMGNLQTTLTLTEKLSHKNYDFILNIWVCGYKNKKENIIQVSRAVFSATGKEIIIPHFFSIAPLISIYSSETAVYNPELLWDNNYCDMESFAVEKVAEYFKIPRLILKVPIDKIWEETKHFNASKALEILDKHIDIQTILNAIESYLSSLSSRGDEIEVYASHYPLTFSENILFEKYFFRYEAILEKDFKDFFETHKHLSKKDFLKTLSDTLDNNTL